MTVNWRLILLHLLFWSLYIVVWGVRDMAYAPTFGDTLEGNLISSGLFAVGVYINMYVLIPRLLLRKKRVAYAVVVLLLVLATAYASAVVFSWYYASISPGTSDFFGSFGGIAATGGDFMVVYGLATCLYFINEWYIKERKLRELETQNLKAELDLLKGQINPHFLFNALNGVHVLIRKNPDKALLTLEKFSELLSHQIYDVNKEQVTLTAEVENLGNFIELQRMRFEEQAQIDWVVKGELVPLRIAPMLFLNFVENAFKYGASPDDSPVSIQINFQVEGQRVSFSCINSVRNLPTSEGSLGVGIANVRRRLEILYPNRHQLDIKHTAETYSVTLQLDLDED